MSSEVACLEWGCVEGAVVNGEGNRAKDEDEENDKNNDDGQKFLVHESSVNADKNKSEGETEGGVGDVFKTQSPHEDQVHQGQ